jgi:hypothetical protein
MHSEQHCSHSPIICSTLNRFLRILNPPISRVDLVEDQQLLCLRNDGIGISEGRTLSVSVNFRTVNTPLPLKMAWNYAWTDSWKSGRSGCASPLFL